MAIIALAIFFSLYEKKRPARAAIVWWGCLKCGITGRRMELQLLSTPRRAERCVWACAHANARTWVREHVTLGSVPLRTVDFSHVGFCLWIYWVRGLQQLLTECCGRQRCFGLLSFKKVSVKPTAGVTGVASVRVFHSSTVAVSIAYARHCLQML